MREKDKTKQHVLSGEFLTSNENFWVVASALSLVSGTQAPKLQIGGDMLDLLT